MTEAELQIQVAEYLRLQYPDVLFHSDFGSGIKLTPGQAVKQKRQNGGRRAWPDMFIAQPILEENVVHMGLVDKNRFRDAFSLFLRGGLFLELKREGTRILKKNGEWASNHIKEQAFVLELLRRRGYQAEFVCGFDEAKETIDEYLSKIKVH